jgi:hypothetical protein
MKLEDLPKEDLVMAILDLVIELNKTRRALEATNIYGAKSATVLKDAYGLAPATGFPTLDRRKSA